MGKSVNEYYAEKMKKLLEMQKSEKAPGISAPQNVSPKEKLQRARENASVPRERKGSATQRLAPSWTAAVRGGDGVPRQDGREYYDKFRNDSGESPKKKYSRPAAETAEQRGRADAAPRRSSDAPRKGGTTPKKTAPEKTLDEILMEEERREEARYRAAKGRRLRKLRDALISVALIAAVAVVLCVVVYRLVFVISDINIEGLGRYTREDILAAGGIGEGDHLYSFRNSVAERLITLRCPAVESVRVDKVAPSTVNLYITEEPAVFYADFYGEYRELSSSLRMLYATDKERAVAEKLILLKLPAVVTAYSGKKADFSGVRSDIYIYDVTSAVRESGLWGDVRGIDLTNKYDVKINCLDRYLITLGESTGLKTKLKIAAEVLKDPMFTEDVKARIDVSDMSATGVITDANLDISWLS